MKNNTKPYGLVICGGESSRMGQDKSMLIYHEKPQRYYIYEMLQAICDSVFISCNVSQVTAINKIYNTIVDLPEYKSTGPVAGLLSAFTQYPNNSFLVVGCDYPFITSKNLQDLYTSVQADNIAAAFYNDDEQLFEPVLGWYAPQAAIILREQFKKGNYSLQYFLRNCNSVKYHPTDNKAMTGINTEEDYTKAIKLLKTND